jgi:hypothetical protein
MFIISRNFGLEILAAAVLGIGLYAMMIPTDSVAEETKTRLLPVVEADAAPELALLMGDLQRLTHKMALSANEGNAKLAAFYMHESLEQLKTIQKDSPEYEGQPVALLIDRLAIPAYEPFQKAVNAESADKDRMLTALDGVIQSCNQCHVATQHPLIKITRGIEVNPFNQSFKP